MLFILKIILDNIFNEVGSSKRKNVKNLQKNKKNKTILLYDEYTEIEESCLLPVTIYEKEDNFNDSNDSSASTQTSTHVLNISDNK